MYDMHYFILMLINLFTELVRSLSNSWLFRTVCKVFLLLRESFMQVDIENNIKFAADFEEIEAT